MENDMRGSEGYEPVTGQQLDTEIEDVDYKQSFDCTINFIGNSSSASLADANLCQCGKTQHASKFSEGFDEKSSAFRSSNTILSSATTRSRKSSLHHAAGVRFLRDWWLELNGCFFITGALIALYVTAYAYQDHPLPSWPNWITINSLLAIYVVILKAAILLILTQGLSHLKWTWFTKSRPLSDLAKYDSASRGPLVSIGLLWALRGRDVVSSIGAVVIVAAVILDPMAQQIIQYWNCPQTLNELNATIPRTNAYMEVGQHLAAGVSTIPIGLQSAINGGVFVPGASTVSYDCTSGNCTFTDPFYTVEFSSECTDVSSELKFSNFTQFYNYTMTTNGTSRLVSQNVTTLNTTLPSGLSTSYTSSALLLTTNMITAYNLSTGVFEIIVGLKLPPHLR